MDHSAPGAGRPESDSAGVARRSPHRTAGRRPCQRPGGRSVELLHRLHAGLASPRRVAAARLRAQPVAARRVRVGCPLGQCVPAGSVLVWCASGWRVAAGGLLVWRASGQRVAAGGVLASHQRVAARHVYRRRLDAPHGQPAGGLPQPAGGLLQPTGIPLRRLLVLCGRLLGVLRRAVSLNGRDLWEPGHDSRARCRHGSLSTQRRGCRADIEWHTATPVLRCGAALPRSPHRGCRPASTATGRPSDCGLRFERADRTGLLPPRRSGRCPQIGFASRRIGARLERSPGCDR